MDNFHYRGPNPNPKSEKSAKLMEELQQIDRQLEEDNRRLAEKKRLEEEVSIPLFSFTRTATA